MQKKSYICRFLRQLGLPAFGFSPLAGSEIMLHEHNEYIDTEVFLRGVPIYEKIILDLASVAPEVELPSSAASEQGKRRGMQCADQAVPSGFTSLY